MHDVLSDATDVTLAQPVLVGAGRELAGVDFTLATARNAVSGRLVDQPAAHWRQRGFSVSLSAAEDLRARRADGRFRITDVPAADPCWILDTSNARSWTTAFRDVSMRTDPDLGL
jgi:hypothetical protein